MTEPGGELIVYRSADGRSEVRLRPVRGTVWLSQAQMAELYGTSVQNVGQIVRRVLADDEVTEATRNSGFAVLSEGDRTVRREVTTDRAVQFPLWATTVLREHLVTGFVLDDQRLKDIGHGRGPMRMSASRVSGTSALFDLARRTVVFRSPAGDRSRRTATWAGDRPGEADVLVAEHYPAEPEIAERNRSATVFLDVAEHRLDDIRALTAMDRPVGRADRSEEAGG